MTVEAFANMTIAEIARITKIAASQWSRYLNRRKGINEKTLEKAGQALGMTSDTLLKAINLKRDLLTNQSRENSILTK